MVKVGDDGGCDEGVMVVVVVVVVTEVVCCHVTFLPCLTPVFCYSDQSRLLPLLSANSQSGP